MNVRIIGTGNMARAIGSRAITGGHAVTVVGKDDERARAVAADLPSDGAVETARSSDPVTGDLVVLAMYYGDARAFVGEHADDLAGKVVVDITNPVNETFDALVVPPDGSATAELAALAPRGRFVKAFNTTTAVPLTEGKVDGRRLDVLIAGDDDDAKARVAALARDAGLCPIDAGPLRRARELEATGLLNITLQNALGTGFRDAFQLIGPR